MTTATRKREIDQDAIEAARLERIATCEGQLAEDRAMALTTIRNIGQGIAKWQEAGWQYEGKPTGEPATWKRLHKLVFLFAQLAWVDGRINHLDGMATPLWCPPCHAGEQFPGNPWMQYECLEHATAYNARTAASMASNWFGGAMPPSH